MSNSRSAAAIASPASRRLETSLSGSWSLKTSIPLSAAEATKRCAKSAPTGREPTRKRPRSAIASGVFVRALSARIRSQGLSTPQLVSNEQLQAANGLMYVTLSVGGIVGPAIGGLLVATVGAGWALLGDALTFALGAALLIRIRPLGYVPAPRETFWQELAGGWREVRSRTWLWVSIVDFAAFQMVYLATIMVLGPLVAKQSLGGAGAWAGILVAFSFGTLLGNTWAMRVRPRRPLVFAWSTILLCGPSLVLLAFRTPAWTIALTEVASGLAIGV